MLIKISLIIFAIYIHATKSLPNVINGATKSSLLEKIHKIDQRVRDEVVNKLKQNNLSDIEPHKHIDAVPIETDGSFNEGTYFFL